MEKLFDLSRGGNSVALKDADVSAGSRAGETNCSAEDRNMKVAYVGIDLGSQTAEGKLDLNTELSGPSKDNDVKLDFLASQKINGETYLDPLRSGSLDIQEEKTDNEQGSGGSYPASTDEKPDSAPKKFAASHKVQSPKETSKIERLRYKEKLLQEEFSSNTMEVKHLEEELELLNAAAEIVSNAKYPADFYVEQLNLQADSQRSRLMELDSEWDAVRNTLEKEKRSLEESIYGTIPEGLEKLRKIKHVELEKELIFSGIEKRKEELSKLIAELEKQPKMESRRCHIQRIIEITKNSRKQDADIERILKETRELQLENNSIQERLHRTYAVLDEFVFRESKKDPAGRETYRLLTSIHETFEQISEKIIATDRLWREVAEYEAKLSAMSSRSNNADKLLADLDALRNENDSMEQRHPKDRSPLLDSSI